MFKKIKDSKNEVVYSKGVGKTKISVFKAQKGVVKGKYFTAKSTTAGAKFIGNPFGYSSKKKALESVKKLVK